MLGNKGSDPESSGRRQRYSIRNRSRHGRRLGLPHRRPRGRQSSTSGSFERQFRAALLASKKAQKALETASRIATKKKTAEAREEFRKAEDQAASAKALATAAQLTVEASTVIFKAATTYLKALIAASKKVDKEVNTQVEVDNDEQSNSSDSEVLDKDVSMDIGNVVQLIK